MSPENENVRTTKQGKDSGYLLANSLSESCECNGAGDTELEEEF